jgi:Fe-S-cluster containining protein
MPASKKDQEIEKIANEARNSISEYCIKECRAFCCRNGYLPVKPKSVKLVAQDRKKELEDKGMLKKLKNGNYSLFLGNYDLPCPSLDLKNFTCIIHKNKLRPKACADFPLIIEESTIKLSPRCPAVRENKFYPYVKMLMIKGLKYKRYENIPELTLYDVELK